MTMPPLPELGDTSWRDDWAQAVHNAAAEVVSGRLTEAAQKAASVAASGRRAGRVYLDDYFGPTRVPGTTDDTAAWTAAVAAAAGKTLIVGANQVRLTDLTEITADDATVDARGAIFDLEDDGTAAGVVIRAVDCGNFTWLGGRLIQEASARTGVQGLLTLRRVDEVMVDALVTEGGTSAGIFVEGGSGIHIRTPRVSNSQADGIHVSRGAVDVTIDSARVSGAGDDAIGIVGVLNDGAVTYPPCRRVQVVNPTVRNLAVVGGGIAFVGVEDCTLTGGIIDNVTTSGVKVTADTVARASTTPKNIGIYGTSVRGADSHGFIYGDGAVDCILANARAFDCGDAGVALISASRMLISGGKFRGNTSFGLYEAAAGSNYAIGADFRGNTGGATQRPGTGGATLTSCITA